MNHTVLVVDDSFGVRQLLATIFDLAGYTVEQAEDGPSALAILQGQQPAVILLDWMMPGMEGPEVAYRIRDMLCNDFSYIIMLTARDSSKDYVTGLRTGVDLYVTKPFDAEVLLVQVEKGVAEFEKRRLAAANSHFAKTDALTGLANRRAFDEQIEMEIQRAKRYQHPLSLVMVDLDHFKAVNDTYGHPVGDQVLRQLADTLRQASRKTDLLFRYGGEEFVVILLETDLAGGFRCGEQLRLAISHHVFGEVGHKTASLGVAELGPEDTAATLLARSDAALYQAKQGGRNRVVQQADTISGPGNESV